MSSYNLYINEFQMPLVRNNMIDFNINEVIGCYLDPQYFNIKINSSDLSNYEKLIENDKELFKNTVDKFLLEKEKYDKYGSLHAFKTILEDIEEFDDTSITNDVFNNLNDYLTKLINDELRMSTSNTASIQDFHKDIFDCLEFYSKDKWFKLRMLNQIDFILEKTLIPLVGSINKIVPNNIITDVTNGLSTDMTSSILDGYKRIFYQYNIIRPFVIVREPKWEMVSYNKAIIGKNDKKYNMLRDYVDRVNMSSFKFSNTNKFQNSTIIDIFYNNDAEEFTLIL